jgi:hypothetical protein
MTRGVTDEGSLTMHRDSVTLKGLAGRSRKLSSKQFATELHDQGYTRDDAIAAVCRVFGVPHRAARLFIDSHPAWMDGAPAEEPEWSLSVTL